MKKNKMMRLASGLLVAVLLTTCAISGTFAKYVTEGTGSDSARIAKWGVEVAVTSNAFSDAYKDDAVTYQENEKGDTITVQAEAKGTKVIAPGTKGTLATVKLTGKAEVDVKVEYNANLTLTGWTVDNAVYCPLVFKVGDETYTYADGNYESVDAFATTVSSAINAYTQTYDTNTDLSTESGLNITWEWPFSTSADNDTKDTELGKAANDSGIAINMTVTATQID